MLKSLAIIFLSYLSSTAFVGFLSHEGVIVKYIALGLPFLLIYLFTTFQKAAPSKTSNSEIVILAFIFLAILWTNASRFGPHLFNPIETDIGDSTRDSVFALFAHHQNPYASRITYHYGLGEDYAGYKYGPGMILSYLPILVLPAWGFKFISGLFLLATCFISAAIVWNSRETKEIQIRNSLVLASALLSQTVLWAELLQRGTVDIVLTFYVLLGLFFLKKKNLLAAGVLFAFSVSCKPSLGLGMSLLLLFHFRSLRAFIGLAVGSLPWIPFAIWDFHHLWLNAFSFHLGKTSWTGTVFSNLRAFSFNFPVLLLFTLIAIAVFKPLQAPRWYSLFYRGTLLMVCEMILFRQIFNNHSMWVLPLFPLLYFAAAYKFDTPANQEKT